MLFLLKPIGIPSCTQYASMAAGCIFVVTWDNNYHGKDRCNMRMGHAMNLSSQSHNSIFIKLRYSISLYFLPYQYSDFSLHTTISYIISFITSYTFGVFLTISTLFVGFVKCIAAHFMHSELSKNSLINYFTTTYNCITLCGKCLFTSHNISCCTVLYHIICCSLSSTIGHCLSVSPNVVMQIWWILNTWQIDWLLYITLWYIRANSLYWYTICGILHRSGNLCQYAKMPCICQIGNLSFPQHQF